jgi:hypothetical protein
MDAFETFTRIARIADVRKHPDVIRRYLEDGTVVEIVDLLTGKFCDGAKRPNFNQEHSRHVRTKKTGKCVSKREDKQMQIELGNDEIACFYESSNYNFRTLMPKRHYSFLPSQILLDWFVPTA